MDAHPIINYYAQIKAAHLLQPLINYNVGSIFEDVFNMPPKRLLSHYKIDALIMSCNAEDMLLPRSNFTFYGSTEAVCGLSSMISALPVNPSKPTSPIYLLPRSKTKEMRDWRIPIEALSQLWVSINLEQNGNYQKCCVNYLNQWNKAIDFPATNQDFCGRKNTYVYAATTSGLRQALPNFPFDTIVKLTTNYNTLHSTWSTRRRRFIGEPIFIPKGGEEDDGYLLEVEYAVSTQRCYLVILDSKLIG
ncbi:carotenoid cleavage dioxygenase 7, chloroplastic [Olea europaea subsp. europaea]|uniref:Carotenoid cleavage dioxygenase 7, chloroplastic n=1 Tax=Olea europaea subsp. europaea TaxID=158383 RepID=A0A8S0PK46_OLEEU|nr:carotenoid cleavage dioxygenase 7, chloroplastic [Olea europaea subsp. europaea]